MNCSKCGASISQIDEVCPYCGTHNDAFRRKIRLSQPVGIENLSLTFIGQPNVEKKIVWKPWRYLLPENKSFIGRGFKIAFNLTDSQGEWTIANGKLAVAILPVKMDSFRGGINDTSMKPLGIDVKAIDYARKESLFFSQVDVKTEQYKWLEMMRQVPGGQQKWEGMVYEYINLDNPVFDRSGQPYHEVTLHVWFQPDNGGQIYQWQKIIPWD